MSHSGLPPLFALVGHAASGGRTSQLPWVVNMGAALLLVGLAADGDILVRIGAAMMGLALSMASMCSSPG